MSKDKAFHIMVFLLISGSYEMQVAPNYNYNILKVTQKGINTF